MSKERKGFVIYGDAREVISRLSNDEAGQLLKGMLDYFVDGKDPKFKGILEFVFIPIRQQMDRDAEKYEKRCEKNRENVKKRWERTNEYERIRTYTNDTNINKDKDIDIDKGRDINKKPRKSGDSSPEEKLYFFADID